jgi:hypothetical protein
LLPVDFKRKQPALIFVFFEFLGVAGRHKIAQIQIFAFGDPLGTFATWQAGRK